MQFCPYSDLLHVNRQTCLNQESLVTRGKADLDDGRSLFGRVLQDLSRDGASAEGRGVLVNQDVSSLRDTSLASAHMAVGILSW